jgi:hypothetical protein
MRRWRSLEVDFLRRRRHVVGRGGTDVGDGYELGDACELTFASCVGGLVAEQLVRREEHRRQAGLAPRARAGCGGGGLREETSSSREGR